MKTLVLIIQDMPYQTNKAYDTLRIAGAALASDMEVKVFLLDKGVHLGCKNHSIPDEHENLESLLVELIQCGLEVQMCGKSMGDYNIAENDLLNGVRKGSMKALTEWLNASDQTISL